jgi:hypothetical protein
MRSEVHVDTGRRSSLRYALGMSDSGEMTLPLSPEELAAWTELKERASRCALALAAASRSIENGVNDVAKLRAVPAVRAAIDDVELSRRACLDFLAHALEQHGKDPAGLEPKREALTVAINDERTKLAAMEKALIDVVGPLSHT